MTSRCCARKPAWDTIDHQGPRKPPPWREGRRRLVVTDGFYEWDKKRGSEQPFAIARATGQLTVMAGLWEEWLSPAKERIVSCTIITTEPNELIEPRHDRMPVILVEADWPAGRP